MVGKGELIMFSTDVRLVSDSAAMHVLEMFNKK